MDKEHKQAWIRVKDSTKEKMIDQWKSQSSGPVTNNHQLRTNGHTVYKLDFEDDNGGGYYSDYTANSEGTYDFNVHSSVYNTTGDNYSNGESVLEGKELNVSAAAATKAKPTSILREKRSRRKKFYRSSEMPAGAVSEMLANKQLELRDPKTNKLVPYMTYTAKMAVMDYSRCDSLLPIPIKQPPPVNLHYKVSLLHQHEMDYRANMSKQDRFVGGRYLALVDGGANGGIIGRDMRIIYFNADGKRVHIEIAGDHHLTGNRLCCGCSVSKSNQGWVKLMWAQGAQVKTQENSILSVVQMRDIRCVVSNVALAHGGKQEILSPAGIKQPLIIKNGLPYLVHQYPTQKQMDEITREEFMTSINDWDPTKYDSPEGESERLIKQFSSFPADITNCYYNDQDNIRVTKGDAIVDPQTKIDPVVVDSEFDSKPDPVKIEPETVVDDSEFDSTSDPVVVESEVGLVVVGKNIQ